jgi:hypothetical protein
MSKKTKKPTPTPMLAIIDADTGNILSTCNLFAVMATQKQLDRACNSDSAAHDLAMSKGHYLPDDLLHALYAKKRDSNGVYSVANAFGWSAEIDNQCQMALYTGVKA